MEWRLDGGSWRSASYSSSSRYYEDSWATTAVADGDHVLDARATDSAGTVSGEVCTSVTVSNTSTGPSVESYSVTEKGSPNPHANITADWTVGDADGDLDTVTVEVARANDGSVVDSSSHGVNRDRRVRY